MTEPTADPTPKRPAMKDGLIKRGSTWTYVVRERDPETGKNKTRWIGGFPTRAAAKRARDSARDQSNRGTYVTPREITVGEYLDQWIGGRARLKPSTAASYKQKIDLYLKPAIGHERLQALSLTRLDAVFRQLGESGGMKGRPLSARSVEYVRAVLRKACNDAVKARILEFNPVLGTEAPPSEGKPKHVTWTPKQQLTFLESQSGSRWLTLWTVALATGMRRGELVALRWEHVDLETGVVSVELSTTQLGTELIDTTPKNHERRRLSLDSRTLAQLKVWRKEQAAERLAWGPAYEATDRVFTWENGRTVQPDYLTKLFVDIQSPDLPRMTLHGTRHTHATTLLRAGVPVHIVAKRLGHKDASVTLNVYADVLPQDDEHAAGVFEKVLYGG